MKIFYDGEDREVLSIKLWSENGSATLFYWKIQYKRGDSMGSLIIQATDELDAMRKFPAELERLSKNEES